MSGRTLWDRLERLLHRERLAGRMDHRDLMALPLDERVERGDSLAGLLFVDEAQGRMRLRCAENQSKFRPGDALRLGNGDDGAARDPALAVIYESYDERTGVVVVSRDPFRRDGRFDPARPLQLDPEDTSLIELALDALGTLRRRGDPAASTIRELLELRAPVTRIPRDLEIAAMIAASTSFDLDEAKRGALVSALADSPAALVKGPPGSGKTLLLALVVAGAARSGDRVLVTAYTHRAVNNALRKIAEIDPGCRVIKAGRASAADDLRGTLVEAVSGLRRVPPPDGRPTAVGATIFGLRSAWDDAPFDRVVFDEAAQVPLAYAPCALLAGRRFLFVGDHRQMGPIVRGDHDDPLATLSIFEHLGEGYPPVLLRTTYRMNEGINAFPSRTFYGGRLVPSPDALARRFRAAPGGEFEAVFDPEVPAVLVTVNHEGFRTRSEPEARAVADLACDLLVRAGVLPQDLAIVAPYRAQLRLIRTLLRRRLADSGSTTGLPVIDTVERIQGQEREAVIVSLTASDPEHLAREQAEFFFSPNRLNVTLTRARTKLVVVCSEALFRAFPPQLDDLVHADVFRRLYRQTPKVDLSSRYV